MVQRDLKIDVEEEKLFRKKSEDFWLVEMPKALKGKDAQTRALYLNSLASLDLFFIDKILHAPNESLFVDPQLLLKETNCETKAQLDILHKTFIKPTVEEVCLKFL